MKHSHWLLCVVIMVGPGKSCHCQTSLKSTSGAASSEIKTYSQSRIELQNLKENAGKVKSVLVNRAAL